MAENSTHPLSRAVVREAERRGLAPVAADDVTNIPGFGMEARNAASFQADVILMHDRIENVPTALRLSRRARRLIRQNLLTSLGTVAVLVTFALAQKIKLSLGVSATKAVPSSWS